MRFRDGWLNYAARLACHELERRDRLVLERLSNFGAKVHYEYKPEVLAMRKQGRKRLEMFQQCRTRLLAQIYKQEEMRLSIDQVRLLDEIMVTMLPKMYGSYQAVHDDFCYLQETLALTDVRDAVSVIYPRRHGKTLTETIAALITALTQPNGYVYVYNPTSPQAQDWLQQFYRFLGYMKDDPTFGCRILSFQSNRLVRLQQNIVGGTVIVVRVYGNATNKRNAQNLRGGGNKAFLIICDEGFFFDVEAYKVIAPTTVNGAGFVIASSRPPGKAATLDLVKARMHSKRLVFNVLDWRRSCAECRALEEVTGQEVVCPHEVRPPLDFRSWLNRRRTEAIMETLGDAHRTEMLNEGVGERTFDVFPVNEIEHAFGPTTTLVETVPTVSHFFVSIDIGGVRGKSQTAMTSAAFVANPFGHPPRQSDCAFNHYCLVRLLRFAPFLLFPRVPPHSR